MRISEQNIPVQPSAFSPKMLPRVDMQFLGTNIDVLQGLDGIPHDAEPEARLQRWRTL